jgi:hypothetical protein
VADADSLAEAVLVAEPTEVLTVQPFVGLVELAASAVFVAAAELVVVVSVAAEPAVAAVAVAAEPVAVAAELEDFAGTVVVFVARVVVAFAVHVVAPAGRFAGSAAAVYYLLPVPAALAC